MNIVHNGMQLDLEGLYRGQDEWSEVSKLSDLCCILFPSLVLYHCDIPEENNMTGLRHGTMVCPRRIRCLLSPKAFERIESGARLDNDVTLKTRENIETLWA